MEIVRKENYEKWFKGVENSVEDASMQLRDIQQKLESLSQLTGHLDEAGLCTEMSPCFFKGLALILWDLSTEVEQIEGSLSGMLEGNGNA